MFNKILRQILSLRLMTPVLGVSVGFIYTTRLSDAFFLEPAPAWFAEFIRWGNMVSYPATAISMFTLLCHYIIFLGNNSKGSARDDKV